MAYYKRCPFCGAALDPGEKCDCGEERETPNKTVARFLGEEIMCDRCDDRGDCTYLCAPVADKVARVVRI